MIWDGSIRAVFKGERGELKIELLEIVSDEFTEFLPRKVAKQTLTPPLSHRSTSPDIRRSPPERTVLSQMSGDVRGNSGHGEERSAPLPKSVVNHLGVPDHVMIYLEVHPA